MKYKNPSIECFRLEGPDCMYLDGFDGDGFPFTVFLEAGTVITVLNSSKQKFPLHHDESGKPTDLITGTFCLAGPNIGWIPLNNRHVTKL